jgi:hypothetical protein
MKNKYILYLALTNFVISIFFSCLLLKVTLLSGHPCFSDIICLVIICSNIFTITISLYSIAILLNYFNILKVHINLLTYNLVTCIFYLIILIALINELHDVLNELKFKHINLAMNITSFTIFVIYMRYMLIRKELLYLFGYLLPFLTVTPFFWILQDVTFRTYEVYRELSINILAISITFAFYFFNRLFFRKIINKDKEQAGDVLQ